MVGHHYIHPLAAALFIDKLVTEKYTHCSVTRLDPDQYSDRTGDLYIEKLGKFLSREGIESVHFSGHQVSRNEVYEWQHPEPSRVFMIAGRDPPTKETDYFLSLVREFPKGQIHDSIAQELSGRESFTSWVRDAEQENKKIFVVGHGPVFYTAQELRNVRALFLGSSREYDDGNDEDD
ncbi:hypothetical protein HYX14_00480 [Candidatus Woesearchaeota archaeon]|nr:hypothetical protein [Candidatus Woesearchaeota archaeon]